jgi:hypothetical protein
MAHSMASIVILPAPTPVADVRATVCGILGQLGAVFDPDHYIIYDDHGDDEREPTTALSEADAWDQIASWPGLGGLGYTLIENLGVYLQAGGPFLVDAVLLAMLSTPYFRDKPTADLFDRATMDLHRAFGSLRTVSDNELLSPSHWIPEEVRRVRAGLFQGQYVRDLR